MKKFIGFFLMIAAFTSCQSPKQLVTITGQLHNNQEIFWQALQQICGNSYEGTVMAAPANDTAFTNKTLLMHVRACSRQRIRIPFFAGNDFSRTWVFTKDNAGLLLKHDHRHRDGSADSVTMYGGHSSNRGTPTMQFFPADDATTKLLPAAGGNVWWIELQPGKFFTYNLRRMGSDRLFSIRFDLSKTVVTPPAPWGWAE